ncbi:hypothetical protein BC940DRAFT_288763 [Gongronella butleri]|nr:hypothetical protein BC940DRAFT_288763 [Gongronella butleri]
MSDLPKDIKRATSILRSFTDSSFKADIKTLIPPSILAKAHGLIFIRQYRAGFVISAKGGTGIIIARLPDGSWSAPSGVSMTSLGLGHLIGGEIIDSVIVINFRGALKAFFDSGGQLQLGVGVSVSAGPVGRTADVSAGMASRHMTATYAYSSSKGLYIGYSFEGSRVAEREQANAAFYGRPLTASDILNGAVAPPMAAKELYDTLYALGAAGPQPGIQFGPVKSNPYGSVPPSPQMPPPGPPMMRPPPHPMDHKPSSSSASFHSLPPNHQYNVPPSPSSPASSIDSKNPLAMAGRSASIRNPPPLNPTHETNTDFAEPPPSYEMATGSSSSSSAAAASAALAGNGKNAAAVAPLASLPPPSPATTTPQAASNVPEKVAAAYHLYSTHPEPPHTPDVAPAALPAASAPLSSSSSSFAAQNAPTMMPTMPVAPANAYPADTKSNHTPAVDTSAQNGFLVVAKYDFDGQEPTDLSFKAGDCIIVTNWTDSADAWWHGILGDRSGNFPANFTSQV